MTKSLRDNMQEWRSTGWLGSEVAGHQFEQINLSTVVIKTKWRDSYADGSEDFECSWNLVDYEKDTWAINYDVVIDCDEGNRLGNVFICRDSLSQGNRYRIVYGIHGDGDSRDV